MPTTHRRRAASRDFAVAVLFVAAVVVVPWASASPQDLDGVPEATPRLLPALTEIEGLAVPAGDGVPAWRAARARPRERELGFSGLALGGVPGSLALRDVEVRLPGGVTLRGARGDWDAGGLRLADVRGIDAAATLRLRAAVLRIADARVSVDGIAVFWDGPERRRRDELEPAMSVAELARRLGAGG